MAGQRRRDLRHSGDVSESLLVAVRLEQLANMGFPDRPSNIQAKALRAGSEANIGPTNGERRRQPGHQLSFGRRCPVSAGLCSLWKARHVAAGDSMPSKAPQERRIASQERFSVAK